MSNKFKSAGSLVKFFTNIAGGGLFKAALQFDGLEEAIFDEDETSSPKSEELRYYEAKAKSSERLRAFGEANGIEYFQD